MISDDVMGDKMAGPGIRHFHLSRVLGRHVDLKLAIVPQDKRALKSIQSKLPHVAVVEYRQAEWETLRPHVEQADVVILPPYTLSASPQFVDYPGIAVIDGYRPLIFEFLTTMYPAGSQRSPEEWSAQASVLYNSYLAADFIICASERQRFWWFGQLEVAGRINPYTYQEDNSLRQLVDVVPYGLPEEPPSHNKAMIKGVWPGIDRDDIVLLWGGGLWPWLDALTAIKAVERLRESHPRLRLVFPGTVHPNQDVASDMPIRAQEAYRYAGEHGLIDSLVFFGEWVPYEHWQSVLLESDIALSLHHDTIETQLAFRSRMLEYFWAGLPLIATTGDATSELVAGYNLGRVVDYGDVEGVAQAIRDILADDSAYQAGFAQAQQDLTWEKAARPLVRFCQNPRRAPDRRAEAIAPMTPQERKIRELENLVAAYRSGRFMRMMKQVDDLRTRWQNWRNRP